jgi:hypothetical protein
MYHLELTPIYYEIVLRDRISSQMFYIHQFFLTRLHKNNITSPTRLVEADLKVDPPLEEQVDSSVHLTKIITLLASDLHFK